MLGHQTDFLHGFASTQSESWILVNALTLMTKRWSPGIYKDSCRRAVKAPPSWRDRRLPTDAARQRLEFYTRIELTIQGENYAGISTEMTSCISARVSVAVRAKVTAHIRDYRRHHLVPLEK